MLKQTNSTMSWMVLGSFCAIALAATACAGGTDITGVTPASPSVAAAATSRVTVTAAVDGPLIALTKAVANCGKQGDVLDVLQKVFAGAGNAPAIRFISDTGSVFTFSLGTTVFAITYVDNGDGHLSCGDTITGATP